MLGVLVVTVLSAHGDDDLCFLPLTRCAGALFARRVTAGASGAIADVEIVVRQMVYKR